MRDVLDLALQTLRSLRAHGLRFALTSLGIFWGATMLTYLSASAIGMERAFKQRMELTGPKTIWTITGAITKDRVGERGARRLMVKDEDVARIESVDIIETTSPELTLWNQVVRARGRTRLLSVVGLDADGLAIRNFEVDQGRLFTQREVKRAAKVAFLGADTKRRLFGRAPAVGRTLRVEGVPLRIVGVAIEKGDQMVNLGDQDDRLVLVPYTTSQRWFQRDDGIERFITSPRTREDTTRAVEGIRTLLGVQYHFDPGSELSLNFIDMEQIWNILDLLFTGLKTFLIGAGIVTLLVGAVGVMNIMIVVVGERVQEIGLRKALGATNRAIFTLFLAEASAISSISGVSGAMVGFALVKLTRLTLPEDDPVVTMPIFDWQTTTAIVVSLFVVGIVAGLIPAARAARIAPAESLRSL